MPCVEICSDGGCEPNPGPGGSNLIFPPTTLIRHRHLLPLPRATELGAVLIHPKKRAEASGGFRKTTNNRMEIFAAIAGLELMTKPWCSRSKVG